MSHQPSVSLLKVRQIRGKGNLWKGVAKRYQADQQGHERQQRPSPKSKF